MSHTPGPWKHTDDIILSEYENRVAHWPACAIAAEGGCVDHVAYATIDTLYPDETKANAKLIAAAPELLEALKGLLAYANEYSDEMRKIGRGAEQMGERADSVSVAGIARAAIAKAT